MPRESDSRSNGGERDGQPKLTDFVEHKCPICGRTSGDNEPLCHPSHVVTFERRLAEQNWLLPEQRFPETSPGKTPVVGSDSVAFEPLYLALRPLIRSDRALFEAYVSNTPYEIQPQEWLAAVFRQHLSEGDELVLGVVAGIRASEDRISRKNMEATPARVFAHLVFLDQYGLLPGYDELRHGSTKSLREICAEHYNVQPEALDSEWVVKRRVDRSKVYSTTPEFRQEWHVGFVKTSSENELHPYSGCKPFDGTAILDDHRDHNLVARRTKAELLRLPNVDWAVSPHFIFSQSTYGPSEDSRSNTPIIGFDVAGFEYTTDGQRLRYLGVVTDWEESLFETYLQTMEIRKTAATGVLIMPNRELIYDFLHYLMENELTDATHIFPESRDGYRSIPNVQALHDQLIREIPLLNEIAVLPRRKLLDEGVNTISDLISVSTYA